MEIRLKFYGTPIGGVILGSQELRLMLDLSQLVLRFVELPPPSFLLLAHLVRVLLLANITLALLERLHLPLQTVDFFVAKANVKRN